MFPFNFQLSGDNSLFFTKPSLHVILAVAMGDCRFFSHLKQLSEVAKKILINSGFARFRWNFNMMKLDF